MTTWRRSEDVAWIAQMSIAGKRRRAQTAQTALHPHFTYTKLSHELTFGRQGRGIEDTHVDVM
jgi:hypothetical protein